MAASKSPGRITEPVTHWHAHNSALYIESVTYATEQDARVIIGDYLWLARSLHLPIKEPTPGHWRICDPHNTDEYTEMYIEECSGPDCPRAISGLEPMLNKKGDGYA